MDWQQKAAVLNAIAQIKICMRRPQDWYIDQSVEVGGDGLLSGLYGNGTTPQAALEDHWRVLVDELKPGFYLVIQAFSPDKCRHVRWNGFMWEDLPISRVAA
jgi:hypothetical protein